MAQRNQELDWLKQVQDKAAEIQAEREEVTRQIREGFKDRAVVFMDVVGSTQFKIDHADKPEVWILRVRQFSELLAEAVLRSNGRVVKFIGDEVMAIFETVYDAQNLVARIDEIEANLKRATGFETRIKVAADYGKVYLLEFDGHVEPDPQGSAVDRCARIGKFGEPGEVLASADFARVTSSLNWVKVGPTDLKGLGRQTIYQLGRATVDIRPTVSLPVEEHTALHDGLQEAQVELATLREKNARLADALRAKGSKPSAQDLAQVDDDDDLWDAVQRVLVQLRQVIERAPGPASKYARFLFLHYGRGGGETYNKFEDRTFNELIDANLVSTEGSGYYTIRPSHPRNAKALTLIESAESTLSAYLHQHGKSEDDLFEWSMSDPEFWENYVNIPVTSL